MRAPWSTALTVSTTRPAMIPFAFCAKVLVDTVMTINVIDKAILFVDIALLARPRPPALRTQMNKDSGATTVVILDRFINRSLSS
jgi:hypothetical protein